MKEFTYKAYDRDGTIIEGRLEAAARKEAAEELFSRDLHPIHVEEIRKKGESLRIRRPFSSRRRLALFAEEWASLLEAGLTITDALTLLQEQAGTGEKKILTSLIRTISSGHGIGESFQRVSCFPPFFISLLQVGEMSGTLPEELHRISRYYEKEEKFIRSLENALAYPLFLVLLALSVFFIVLTFILPSFSLLFEALAIPFPPMAAAALSLGLWMQGHGLFLLFCTAILLLAAAVFFRTGSGKSALDSLLYRSAFYRRLLLTRFCYTLSALLESGQTLSDSLANSRRVLGNHKAALAIASVQKQLEKGGDFPEALEKSGFSFPLAVHLARVGMESGELPRFLRHAGHLLTAETEQKLLRFRSLLTPCLLFLTGGMTAFLVFSIMLPVFRAASAHMGG